MWALVGEQGAVLKRGHELGPVLAPVERRLMKLVEELSRVRPERCRPVARQAVHQRAIGGRRCRAAEHADHDAAHRLPEGRQHQQRRADHQRGERRGQLDRAGLLEQRDSAYST